MYSRQRKGLSPSFRGDMMRFLILVLAVSVLAEASAEDPNEAAYCAMCKYHTMCATRVPGPNCENHKSIQPNEEEKQALLILHNNWRNNVANSNEPRGNPGPQYPATNMMKVEWDDELAKFAQREADQCIFMQDCTACRGVLYNRFNVGQNSATRSRTIPYSSVNFTRLAEGWYEKKIDLVNSQIVKQYASEGWSQLAQILSWNSRLIGCGASLHSRDGRHYQLLFCNYGSMGITLNSQLYNIGKPGSRCPEGSTNSDPVYDALCVIQDPLLNGTFHTDNVLLGREGKRMKAPACEKKGFRKFY